MKTGRQTEDAFVDYVTLILKASPGQHYLSKNNNNILRLPSLTKALPQAHVIIPFRDPLQHAFSLMRQHRNFVDQGQDDPFTQNYMRWLAHHEFGPGHRPFIFDHAEADILAQYSPDDDLAYWLQLWINVYQYILAHKQDRQILVSYERLCDDTETVWAALCDRIGLPPQAPTDTLINAQKPVEGDVPGELMDQAFALYDQLLNHSL
jgi:hypothetical protein